MRGDDFILNEDNLPIYFQRADDLKKTILNYSPSAESVKIGIALGSCPLTRNAPTMKLIYDGIFDLMDDLNSFGIKLELLEEHSMPEFILDTVQQKILLPNLIK